MSNLIWPRYAAPIFGEHLGGRTPAEFFLVIEIAELLAANVFNDEGGVDVFKRSLCAFYCLRVACASQQWFLGNSHCRFVTGRGSVRQRLRGWHAVRVLSTPPRSPIQTEISRFFMKSPQLARIRARICLCRLSIGFQGSFRGLCLCPAKSPFPTAEAGVGGDSVRILSQCDGRPIDRDGFALGNPIRCCDASQPVVGDWPLAAAPVGESRGRFRG
jgi:hypothetical protein